MTVVLLALGSRGDVEPLAALAAGLQPRGVRARIVALSAYAEVADRLGVEFRAVRAGLEPVATDASTRVGRIVFDTPLGQAVILRRWLSQIADPVTTTVLDSVDDGDTVLTGVLTRDVATALAEARGCRVATIIHTAQLPTAHPGSHFAEHLTRSARRNLALTRFSWQVGSTLGSPIARRVRDRLGRPRLRPRAATAAADKHPVILAASPILVPPAPDWPAHAVQTGHLTAEPQPCDPPAVLTEFLAAGPAPVYVGFGSLTALIPQDVTQTIITAAKEAGVRVITQGVGINDPASEHILTVGQLPHSWLFPRMAAVIHHGGAGTTYAGLRAGVPSMAVPFAVDQPFHGRRLQLLGVGPAPLRARRVTAENLAGRIRALVHGPAADSYRRRAAEVGRACRDEDGVGETIRVLDRWGYL